MFSCFYGKFSVNKLVLSCNLIKMNSFNVKIDEIYLERCFRKYNRVLNVELVNLTSNLLISVVLYCIILDKELFVQDIIRKHSLNQLNRVNQLLFLYNSIFRKTN